MFILLWTGNLNSNQMMNSSNGLYWDADTGFWVAWVIYTGGGGQEMSLYSYVNTMEIRTWEEFSLVLLLFVFLAFLALFVFCFFCFFGLTCFFVCVLLAFWLFLPPCAILALADSVQSPIVSFTQYCLLASSTTIYWKKRET